MIRSSPTLVVMIAFCGLSCALLGACAKPVPPVQAPHPVVVQAPQPLGGPAGVEAFPGSVHARTEADLSFRVPGKIAQRKVDMGARVAAGTVLAVLDPEDSQLNLQAARAAVAAAEADLWLAREEETRFSDLKQRGHVGQSALDQRVNTTKLAQARLEQARSQSDLAQNQSRYTRLTADAAGVITQVIAEAGNVVSAGQPVVRFAADGEREVRISVPEGRVGGLRAAPQVAIELYNVPGRRYVGKVREINPQADSATRTHQAHVTIVDAPEDVQLGASATVILLAAGDSNTFSLPATALGEASKQPAVWTLRRSDDGSTTVQPVPVQVLQYLNEVVIVTGELGPDDRLVSAGVHRLIPGMAVTPIERSAKAAL